jgi:tRNA U55 pseudouridine synthase TruB
MASGALLVLIGDECKRQSEYHGLDKEYEFSVLLGISSDTGDVLGRLTPAQSVPTVTESSLKEAARSLTGEIALPYPHFSSKTVRGKPLHTWTLEGRLNEIEIPKTASVVHELKLEGIKAMDRNAVAQAALQKIETIPPVTDPRKALGNDFRRVDVRQDWNNFLQLKALPETYTIATFRCIASSGTYMRSLSEEIAKKCDTRGLAWHIHRSLIGRYNKTARRWTNSYVQ